jgi:hypothetical protein
MSKFVIAHRQGPRNKALIRRLLEDGAQPRNDKHVVALFTDGEPSYASVIAEMFGVLCYPGRNGRRGCQERIEMSIDQPFEMPPIQR